MAESINKQLAYLEYVNRENAFQHHAFEEEMLQYEYIKNGDPRANDEAAYMISSRHTGHLSDDPLKNRLYLCICNITMVTRAAIEGGMDPEKAYNTSDLYIRRFDKAKSEDELLMLRSEMIAFFTSEVAATRKKNIYSKPILKCIDYIGVHLHESLTVAGLALEVGLNESYLSTLFKKEVGIGIAAYVTKRRMEAAENMLKYSDFSLSEISDILHYASYSHFARVFRQFHNMSPKEYRNRNYRKDAIRFETNG
ncbi:MAG: helix-turn-helix domain-containing protein [Eubacterium sp.]|nr:helix-turn-helix domain-containing protein [Eubacterium sp.]